MVKFEISKKLFRAIVDFNIFDVGQNRAFKINVYAVGIWNIFLEIIFWSLLTLLTEMTHIYDQTEN